MGYNGVGLKSAKGSATSGHVTKSYTSRGSNSKDELQNKNYLKRKKENNSNSSTTKTSLAKGKPLTIGTNSIHNNSYKSQGMTQVRNSGVAQKRARVQDIHALLSSKKKDESQITREKSEKDKQPGKEDIQEKSMYDE